MKVKIIDKKFKDIERGDNIIITRKDIIENNENIIGIVIKIGYTLLHYHKFIKVITYSSYHDYIIEKFYEHGCKEKIKVLILENDTIKKLK